MSALFTNLQKDAVPSKALAGLAGYVAQLVGEALQFIRLSYGDELTIHFGQTHRAKSKKLDLIYGSHVVGCRASGWLYKSSKGPLISNAQLDLDPVFRPGIQVSNETLENSDLMSIGSRVIAAVPFTVKQTDSIGLQISTSDGEMLLVIPSRNDPDDTKSDLPPIADWELFTPAGVLAVGPGMQWSFKSALV